MGMLATWVRDSARFQMGSAMPASGDRVNDVLSDWYEYEKTYRPKLGFEPRAAMSSGFQSSRQWDQSESDDGIDEALSAARAQIVADCIDKLEPRLRIAIQTEMRNRSAALQVEMRNLAAGASVYRDVRHVEANPADFRAAVALLIPMLTAHGLIDKKLAGCKNRA
jgi:hypothetical protein